VGNRDMQESICLPWQHHKLRLQCDLKYVMPTTTTTSTINPPWTTTATSHHAACCCCPREGGTSLRNKQHIHPSSHTPPVLLAGPSPKSSTAPSMFQLITAAQRQQPHNELHHARHKQVPGGWEVPGQWDDSTIYTLTICAAAEQQLTSCRQPVRRCQRQLSVLLTWHAASLTQTLTPILNTGGGRHQIPPWGNQTTGQPARCGR
jgi:hypothetical protein